MRLLAMLCVALAIGAPAQTENQAGQVDSLAPTLADARALVGFLVYAPAKI